MSLSLQHIKQNIKGSISTENDPDYDISRWAKNASRKAKYVVCPKDAEDVSQAIQYAKAEKLDLAIRGGGHSTSGASSSEGGLVIDLSKNMNGVRIDPENKLAYVQGGSLWGTVDAEAIKHGLAGCAGVVSHVGVGGLTVGGGIGYKVGTHGLAIDNLVGATVVVASGEILTASDQENPDLFWAIRGGGSNFGVVTEFIFRLHDQRPDVYSSTLIFPPPTLAALGAELVEWRKTQPPHQSILMLFVPAPDGSPVILCSCFSNSDEAEGAAAFKRFVDLGPVRNISRQIPYAELNQLMNPNVLHGSNRLQRGVRIPVFSPDLLQKVFEARLKLVTEHPEAVHSNVIWEFYNLEKMASVDPEATAFPDRSKNIIVLVGVNWTGDSFSPLVPEESRKLTNSIASAVPENYRNSVGYGNYNDAEALNAPEEVSRDVFGVNYSRLQEVKKKHDPEMLFNKWFPIRPCN